MNLKLKEVVPDQDTWGMLAGGDADGRLTAVAVGVAKLGEPALVSAHKDASSFVGTGRALSVAAGRLSYVHRLKVIIIIIVTWSANPKPEAIR